VPVPTVRPPLLVQVEPAPVTVTVPCEPANWPMMVPPVVPAEPAPVTVTVPEPPVPPMVTPPPPVVQVEPAPVTVTVPCEPLKKPTVVKLALLTVPPLWIVSMPVPNWPTKRERAVAPAVPTTVGFGVVVSMEAIWPGGRPAVQLPGVNQSEELVPFQKVSCARGDDVAASNAAAAVVANKSVRISPPTALRRFSQRSWRTNRS